jgi:hypothetical protein
MGRTRTTIVAISAGLVSVLIMAGVAAASRGSNDSGRPVRVEDRTSSTPSTADSSSVDTTNAPGVTAVEPGDNGNDTSTTMDTSTTVEDHGNDGVGTPTTIDDHGNDGVGHDAVDDNGVDTSTTLAPIVTGERTFTVAGGTVVIDINADHSLTLVSVTPNAGVSVKDQRSEGDEVRVEFRGPNGDSQVRVRFDEGQLRVETGDN